MLFEAPGDRLYASRLGYNLAESENLPIWHFGRRSDPLFVGKCQGQTSVCYLGGYAMESRCHIGKVCLLDQDDKVDVRRHQIAEVVSIISGMESAPACAPEVDCTDCEQWKFV